MASHSWGEWWLRTSFVPFRIPGRPPPPQVGYVQWRAAFYVAGADGAVRNFMHLFDDFFVFKAKQASLVASS